jgi:hypothetical protein
VLLLLQVVQLFDSWAHHLSPKQFSEFSWPYAEQLIERVKSARPHVPLIFHANGGTGKLHIIAKRSHQDVVVGLDWATDMQEARSQFGADTVLQVGNNYSCWPDSSAISHVIWFCSDHSSLLQFPSSKEATTTLIFKSTFYCRSCQFMNFTVKLIGFLSGVVHSP